MDSLTVVIPTYNRAEVLKKALNGYKSQSAVEAITELIVVDDGSTDHTKAVVEETSKDCTFPVRYLWQPNKGPAAARNVGIAEARSGLILFSDSDIVPERDLISQHLKSHRENPENATAILGYVTWPPEPKPTPFMKWYGEAGPLFAFRRFTASGPLSFDYFYTCNVSMKLDFLRINGQFDEEFKIAAYEDIELGYRLIKAGMVLLYNPNAVAYHHQYFHFEDACRKAQANRTAIEIFFKKEAGRHILVQQKKRQSRIAYRMARSLALVVGAIFSPTKRLMDSYVRLPPFIYHLIYWYHANCSIDSYSNEP